MVARVKAHLHRYRKLKKAGAAERPRPILEYAGMTINIPTNR
jgi:hypothetical protein